ncbi:hypothetical protein K456DRAFT_754051 [Colletotrichum gloeosporioides 23]|nr:hypothetical protein K456DRAFT_754051 [Colletotrichum gloeosporioides 23]
MPMRHTRRLAPSNIEPGPSAAPLYRSLEPSPSPSQYSMLPRGCHLDTTSPISRSHFGAEPSRNVHGRDQPASPPVFTGLCMPALRLFNQSAIANLSGITPSERLSLGPTVYISAVSQVCPPPDQALPLSASTCKKHTCEVSPTHTMLLLTTTTTITVREGRDDGAQTTTFMCSPAHVPFSSSSTSFRGSGLESATKEAQVIAQPRIMPLCISISGWPLRLSTKLMTALTDCIPNGASFRPTKQGQDIRRTISLGRYALLPSIRLHRRAAYYLTTIWKLAKPPV